MREGTEQLQAVKNEVKNFPHLEIIEKIGQGSFGDIYKVWDSRREKWAAMKFEKRDKKNKYSLLRKEAQIMEEVCGSKHFPSLFDSRFYENHGMGTSQQQCPQYNFLEMTFLGPNLESLKKRMGGKFSLRTVLLIANQMITGLEALHVKGIIHRDIKPENFVIGSEGQHHSVFVIDFGLSKYYIEEGGKHIEQKQNKGLVGTARYTSVNSHLGQEQSRRDDLESLGYLLLYFVRGNLIWQNLQVKDKEERFQKIAELKQTTSSEALCRGLPKAFFDFLSSVRALGFEQTPDYNRYRQFFSNCYRQNFTTPESYSCYDWCPKNCPLIFKQIQQSQQQQSRNLLIDSSLSMNQQQKQGRTLLNEVQINGTPKNINMLQKEHSNTLIRQESSNNKLAQSTLPVMQLGQKSDSKFGIPSMASSTGLLPNSKSQNNFLAVSIFNQKTMNSGLTDANNLSLSAQQQQGEDINYNYNNKVMPKVTKNPPVSFELEKIQKTSSKELLAMLDKHAIVSPSTHQISDRKFNNNNHQPVIRESEDTISECAPAPVSEHFIGEKNKQVPVFVAQSNYHCTIIETKNHIGQVQQSKSIFANVNLLTSINNNEVTKNTSDTGKRSFEGKPDWEASLGHQQCFITGVSNSQNQLGFQVLSLGNLIALNRDNSQYVNNQSNEWNSEQDEKVDIQQVLPFHSSLNNQQQR